MPNNYERGAFEPSDELRVFDGGEDDEDVEGSRLPLLIVIALLVLAAFGGVVWLAYQRGVAQGHAEVPRVIAAEPGPVKVLPTDAGGTATPYTGLKIYQQPAPSNEDAESDSAPPPSAPAAIKPQPAMVKPAPAPAKPVAAPVAAPLVSAPPTAPSVTLAPVRTVDAAATKPTTLAPPESAAPAPAPAPAAVGGGLIQIGAYKSDAEANAAWASYKAKHASLLSGSTPDVKQVDLGAKGTWYRLRIAAGSKSSAAALCEKLKAEGGACFAAK